MCTTPGIRPNRIIVARASRPCRPSARCRRFQTSNLRFSGFRFCCALLLLLGCAGCASHGGTLQLQPRDADRTLTQDFSSAYITQSRGGEYEIVLVNQPRYKGQNPKKPLQPQPLAPTRQVMHLHLYWKPLTDRTRDPAAVNAAIDWYVLGSDATQDVVLYEGAGVVTVYSSGKQRRVVITDGAVRPRESRGAMQDPVGNSRISGAFIADLNRTRVREILADLRETDAAPQASSR
jgi:hypothetical protein